MAPDRGSPEHETEDETRALHRASTEEDAGDLELSAVEDSQRYLAEQAEQPQNFTFRGTVVGLAIGVIICFSNTYFGLQTGWISGMTMPASLIGFAFFKSISKHLDYPFTPVENVLVQTVAGAVGTMPLGCGFVGVIPALNYLLKPEENGPMPLSTANLILWSLGICFFGVVFAVPLRKQVIIREKLKFPTGTATALIISVLHGGGDDARIARHESGIETAKRKSAEILRSRSRSEDMLRRSSSMSGIPRDAAGNFQAVPTMSAEIIESDDQGPQKDQRSDWKSKIRLLVVAFGISAVYTLSSYFIPQIHHLPVFGLPLARDWLWTLNPSPAYVGQGIVMGPATTLHMLLGAIVGWGILSPLAKSKGWATGPVDDWQSGSKGWIVWVSLAVMLADSIISLGWLVLRPLIIRGPQWYYMARDGNIWGLLRSQHTQGGSYTALPSSEHPTSHRLGSNSDPQSTTKLEKDDSPDVDAPPAHLVPNRIVLALLVVSIAFCVLAIRTVFGSLVPFYAIFLALVLALLLSIMGVRAQGETDLNPVSGISKLTQLIFALVIPSSNPNAVTINLLAGAISESGALQAGDMMQDLKTGHLLGASPRAQFYGQMIGSAVGAVVSAGVYKLYTSVYQVPGGLFQVPTGYVWIFTARLVTGKGLPPMAWQWALGAGMIFAVMTALRIKGQGRWWQAWVPGGIAVAVGMYNTPSFTLARTIGGLVNWYWRWYRKREDTPVIVLASGLILGEGLVSILNLCLASMNVPHW
ncbi:OPT super [Xanthoria calcicola]